MYTTQIRTIYPEPTAFNDIVDLRYGTYVINNDTKEIAYFKLDSPPTFKVKSTGRIIEVPWVWRKNPEQFLERIGFHKS